MIGASKMGTLSTERALAYLKGLDAKDRAKMLAGVVLGIPLSFLGPGLVAGIYWMAAFGRAYDQAPPFMTVFAVCCVVVIPVMYVSAWRRQGNYSEEYMEGGGIDPYVGARVFTTLFVFDIVLFAPNMVIWALRRYKARENLGYVSVARVAAALSMLAGSEESLPPGKLVRAGESSEIVGDIFALLLHHGLIDISKSGDRVWLLSETRRKLPTG